MLYSQSKKVYPLRIRPYLEHQWNVYFIYCEFAVR